MTIEWAIPVEVACAWQVAPPSRRSRFHLRHFIEPLLYYSGQVLFQGPLDEYSLHTSTFTAGQSLAAFEKVLNGNRSTAQTMLYSLEIHDE